MSRVQFERICKTFADGTRALVDFDLTVEDGELLVLVGPSGCGKSTALRILSGLEEPDTGTLRIGERTVNALPPQDRNVAMVFQDYALYPHMTVRQNLEFPLKMRRLTETERAARVQRTADLLEIGELLERLPKQLSGGQRQRVAMGRALVREPAVFLLDEPLSNLDARLRVQVRAEIADLQRRTGTTMIYVTHDQVEAMTLGDRIAVLDRGVLQQVAAPAEIYERPSNTFVAGFIGNPPANLLPSVVALDRDSCSTVALGGERLTLSRALQLHDGDRVTIGIRPEELFLEATADFPALDAVVEHVERLGHETLVHAQLSVEPAVRLVARIPGLRELARGTRVRLHFDPSRLLVFDADSTVRLECSTTSGHDD